jgi:hypothetical protein
MTQIYADDRPALPKDGFLLRYSVGAFEHSLRFDDKPCNEVIEYMANFLLGCGFHPGTIVSGFKEHSEKIERQYHF